MLSPYSSGRSWCERWLRGVSEQLWLGSQLCAHLSDISSLRQIVDCAPLGSAVHLTLTPTATLDQLEEMLAPVLPGAADWHAGVSRLYSCQTDEMDAAA